MDLGDLRQLLARWAGRQSLVRRVHVIGTHARGAPTLGAPLHLVIELDPRVDWQQDAAAIQRWQTQLGSALPVPVVLTLHADTDAAQLRAALHEANVCVFERRQRDVD